MLPCAERCDGPSARSAPEQNAPPAPVSTTQRTSGSWAERDALWGRCYRSLTERAEARLAQEVARLGGSCAHVLDEQVTAKVDDATGAMWLIGVYRYVLYRHPPAP